MLNFQSQIYNSNVKSKNIQERAYISFLEIISFMSKLPSNKIFGVLNHQLLKSATSIGANIIEAQSSISRREFVKFYEIALKSANETKYWLGVIGDSVKELEKSANKLLTEPVEISKMLASSVLTLKGKIILTFKMQI